MSLIIEHIVLHQLQRKDENNIEIHWRDRELDTHEAVVTLITEMNRVYQTKSKAYGLFHADSLFAESVREFRQGNQNFLNFTQGSTKYLRNELIQYPFVEGGTVIFCLYRYLANEYLLIAVINSCQSTQVDDKLDICSAHHLDVDRADIIARLDLTEWEHERDSRRYLTFLKGRVGRKVSDFFMDYLGAEEGIDPKKQNQSLVQAVNAYCDTLALETPEKQACFAGVYDYCQQQLSVGENIKLSGLATKLPQDENCDFLHFLENKDISLETEFPANRQALKSLKKFSGSGGGLTLQFDIGLLGDRIHWDPDTDTLTILGIPPNLRDQLQRNIKVPVAG